MHITHQYLSVNLTHAWDANSCTQICPSKITGTRKIDEVYPQVARAYLALFWDQNDCYELL